MMTILSYLFHQWAGPFPQLEPLFSLSACKHDRWKSSVIVVELQVVQVEIESTGISQNN